MIQAPTADIFSFVNVRTPRESLPRRTFLALPQNTPLQDNIRLNGFPTAEAANFLYSPDNPEQNGTDPTIESLVNVHGRYLHDNPQDATAAEDILKDETDKDLGDFLSAHTSLRNKLIDLTYASMLSDTVNAQQKYRYQSALKVFIALENLAEITANPDGMLAFLDTPLLLSQEIFAPLKEQQRMDLQMQFADLEYKETERQNFRRTLWEELINAHVALTELQGLEKNYHQVQESRSEIFDNGQSSTTTSAPFPRFRDAPVKTMLQETGQTFSTNGITALAQHLPNYENLHPSQAVDLLTTHVSKSSQLLYNRFGIGELFEFANYVNRPPAEVMRLEGLPIVGNDDLSIGGTPEIPGTSSNSSSSIPDIFQRRYPVGDVRPLGIGDLKVVRQKLLRYEAGEVAQIENVMASETKTVTHRKLSRTEQLQVELQERTTETTTDRSTTDRFELNRESSQTIKEDTKKSAGAEVSTSYGVVKAKASGAYSSARSSQKAKKDASQYARQVVSKATEKVIEKVREERSTKRISETEDTYLHSFENNKPDSTHIRGLYRWVDKVYEAQIFNYGKRLMFEFIVPEPSAHYVQMMAGDKGGDPTIRPPKPLPENFNLLHIHPFTFAMLAHEYNVQNVALPRPSYLTLSKTFSASQLDVLSTGTSANDTADLQIPEYYETDLIRVTSSLSFEHVIPYEGHRPNIDWSIISDVKKLSVNVGNSRFDFSDSGSEMARFPLRTGKVPISLTADHVTAYAVNIEVKCRHSTDGYLDWQKTVYDQIMEAYQLQMATYEEAMRQAAFRDGLDPENRNTTINARIVRDELQRACLNLLTTNNFNENGAMVAPAPPYHFPEINLARQRSQRDYIQFMEQAFEWTEMTYRLYGYFWGRKSEWTDIFLRENVDPAFRDFLRAGAGRVVLPVNPGFEDAVLHYLETGILWSGGDAPVIDDPLFRSIAQEMRNEYAPEGEPEGEAWEVRLPTSLLLLQDDATLPDFTPEPEV